MSKNKIIEKKVRSDFYIELLSKQKTFELRLADWDCQKGDILKLIEIDHETKKPTGRSLRRKIGYVLKTKELDLWQDSEIQKNGYQVISLLDEQPSIRIQDGWFLRQNTSQLRELKYKNTELVTDEWMKTRVSEYNKAWKKVEDKILIAMTNIMGLSFRQNIIDVYIAPYFTAFSYPLVIGVSQEPDVFIDTLTHELIHRLLVDNTSIPYQSNILLPEWERMFGKDQDFGVLVHIPVHAILKAIYLDILKQPQRLDRDIKMSDNFASKEYIKAWNYVEKNGYKDIIEELKKSYKNLQRTV